MLQGSVGKVLDISYILFSASSASSDPSDPSNRVKGVHKYQGTKRDTHGALSHLGGI